MKFSLNLQTLKELALIRDLGPEKLAQIKKDISEKAPYPLLPEDLYSLFKDAGVNEEFLETIVDHLLVLCNVRHKKKISFEELLEYITLSIREYDRNGKWNEDEVSRWLGICPVLVDLLSDGQIAAVYKAQKIAFSYDNLYEDGKIITDIRPIFNDDCSEMVGSIVSFLLNISYVSGDFDGDNGVVNKITIALDIEDVNQLLRSCKRAIVKADFSKKFMEENGISQSYICGE